MKDIALAENEKKIRQISALVDVHEKIVIKNFNLIFERYLGDRRDIQSVYKAFIDWKIIRNEVISFKVNKKHKKAADITRGVGAVHVALLNSETQKLIDFADNKAKHFHDDAVAAEEQAFIVITLFLFLIVLVSSISAYYTVRRLKLIQRDMQTRIHLIDQNILMANLDINGIVVDISNHLCRFLRTTKKDIIGQNVNFFIINDDGDVKSDDVLKVVSTGKSWEGQIRRISDKGVIQWLYSFVHPVLDENYNVTGYTNIFNDVTDQELSITDPLTGLHNRRHFDDILEKEIRIANRNKTFITLAIIDIDFFKKYNDHYGHPEGDRALKMVAKVLKETCMRSNDYAFRVGGEEFAIIFSGLNANESFSHLEMVRNKIETLEIEHKKSSVCEFLTISLGAKLNEEPDEFGSSHFYIAADKALYEAKRRRNHIVVS